LYCWIFPFLGREPPSFCMKFFTLHSFFDPHFFLWNFLWAFNGDYIWHPSTMLQWSIHTKTPKWSRQTCILNIFYFNKN
jgi:hypothetical protein